MEVEMNNTRLLKLTIVPALILAAIVALQAFGPSAKAENSGYQYTGLGEWRRFEVQQDIPDTGSEASGVQYGRGNGAASRSNRTLTVQAESAGASVRWATYARSK
jgi:hypothetical protein